MIDLSTPELVIALFIHLVVPLLGLIFYIYLLKRMKIESIKNPPDSALFLIVANYSGLLILILTFCFWYWSFMALIGSIYLVFIAPIVMLGISLFYLRKRNESKYHKITFYSALIYIPLLIATYITFIKND